MKDKIAIALAFLAAAGARAADVYWTQAVGSSSPTEVAYSDSVWSATPASSDTCYIGRNGSMGSTTGDDDDFLVTFESLETLGAKTLWVENNGKTMTWRGSAIANGFALPEFNIGTLGKIVMQNGTFSATGDVAVGAYRAGALTIDNNATFTAETLRVGRYTNGDGTLTINKDGVAKISTIYIADNDATSKGEIAIDGGTLNVTSLNIAQTGKTTGTVTLKSGTLAVTGDAKLACGAGASGATTKGSLNIENGTASFEKALYLCYAGWSETELNISGGETTVAGDFDIGRGSTAVATVSGGKLVANGNTRIGRNSGGNGTLRITGGEVTLANNVYMADGGGTGTLEVDGGTLTVTHEFRGAQGGNTTSTILVKSGTANFSAALDIANNDSTCTMTVSGGEVNCGSEIYVGRSNAGANGTLTLEGGTVSVGTASATRRLKLAIDNSTGTLNLNEGGTLKVWRIDASGSKNAINFNGGTLVALGTSTSNDNDYFWGKDSNNANIAIGEKGVVIDTAGFDKKTGTAVAITGSGTITKAGEGKLEMLSLGEFAGSFVLDAGTLVLPSQKTVTTTVTGYMVAESESSGAYTYTLVEQPCKIGETYYDTLDAALAAANAASPVATIEINAASCTDAVTVASGQTLVLKAESGQVYTGTITLNGGTLKLASDCNESSFTTATSVVVGEGCESTLECDYAFKFHARLSGSGVLDIPLHAKIVRFVEDNSAFTGTMNFTGNAGLGTDACGFLNKSSTSANGNFAITGTFDKPSAAFYMEQSGGGTFQMGTLTAEDKNAGVVMMRSGTILELGGNNGDSVLNNQFAARADNITIRKTGSGKLTLGSDFKTGTATALGFGGSYSGAATFKLDVRAGSLVLENPDLSGMEVTILRGVTVTGKAMFDTGTLKYCDENGNTLLASYDGTTITTTAEDDETSAAALFAMISGTAEAGQDETAFAKTLTGNGDGTWTVASALDTAAVQVEPAAASETVTATGVAFTIPAANVKAGLYYAVSTSSDNATFTTGDYVKASASGVAITAALPESGVKFYKISVADKL